MIKRKLPLALFILLMTGLMMAACGTTPASESPAPSVSTALSSAAPAQDPVSVNASVIKISQYKDGTWKDFKSVSDPETVTKIGGLLADIPWDELGGKPAEAGYAFTWEGHDYRLIPDDEGCAFWRDGKQSRYFFWKDGAADLCRALGVTENVPLILAGNVFAYGDASKAVQTVLALYGEKACLATFQQAPFGEGTLVLAGFTDGESYPDLCYVNKDNQVEYRTQGSDCWMLNYTVFQDKNIYFGLAAREAYFPEQAGAAGAAKVTAVFRDGSDMAEPYPRDTVIAVKNPAQTAKEYGHSAQGYILVSNRSLLPQALEIEKQDGAKASASELVYKSEVEKELPAYLDTDDLRKAAVFRYSPMLAAEETEAEEPELSFYTGPDNAQTELYFDAAGAAPDTYDATLTGQAKYTARSFQHIFNHFKPGGRILCMAENGGDISCYGLRLTKEIFDDKPPWRFEAWGSGGDIRLPKQEGDYLLVLCIRIADGKYLTYTGIMDLSKKNG